MKHQDYLLKMKVGKAIRTIKWNGVDPISLDHPVGWILEPIETGFRLFDGTEKDKEIRDSSSVFVDKEAWLDHLHIDLPPVAKGSKNRHMGVDLVRLQHMRPAYTPSAHPTAIIHSKPQQLFLFYGLRYFLVRYRPIGNYYVATIGEHKIFSYEKVADGYKITPIREAIKLKLPNEKKRTLSVGQSYVVPESVFFSATFLLSVHWWRFQSVPTPDALPPIETEETVDDAREAERLKNATHAFAISFALLVIGMFFFSKSEPKIIAQTTVELKQPKIVPLKEPPKIVEKKPEPPPPEKKIAEKIPKPEPKPKPEPVKKVTKTPKPPKKQVAKKANLPKPVVKAPPTPPPTPKSVLPPNPGLIAKKSPPAPPPPNPNAQLMKSLSFLGTSSSKPVAQVPSNYQGKVKNYDPKAVAVGGGSDKSVLNDMVNVSTDSKINTQSARNIAGGIQFGDKGGGKGLNSVQGKVSSKELYNPNAKFGNGIGGGGMSLSGPGSIPESEIEKALSKFMSKFQFCYEKALLSNPGLAGNIVFKWTIETGGKTNNPKVVKSQMNNAQLHSCIGDVLKQVPFPKPKGGTVDVTKTFTFSSATL